MACSSASMVSIFVFAFALFVQIALGTDHLYEICLSNSGHFTSYSSYGINLNNLLRDLTLRTPATGFSTGCAGYRPDEVFGLAQCRGDVSKSDCHACINDATLDIRSLCPNIKAAMVWYETCFLKYSDVDFIGTIDSSNGSVLPNLPTATYAFRQNAVTLLSSLSEEASVAPKMFAAGETELLGNSTKIFGFVDCTRDLSSSSCKSCIDLLVSLLQRADYVIGSRVGGKIITASCSIRFETYPFFNATATGY